MNTIALKAALRWQRLPRHLYGTGIEFLPLRRHGAVIVAFIPADDMMTSSNGNIFCVTGPLCGEFTGHRWIPLTKASDAELWCFLWSAPWINGWVSNREAGDLRRHHAHDDVSVMQGEIRVPRTTVLPRSSWNVQDSPSEALRLTSLFTIDFFHFRCLVIMRWRRLYWQAKHKPSTNCVHSEFRWHEICLSTHNWSDLGLCQNRPNNIHMWSTSHKMCKRPSLALFCWSYLNNSQWFMWYTFFIYLMVLSLPLRQTIRVTS